MTVRKLIELLQKCRNHEAEVCIVDKQGLTIAEEIRVQDNSVVDGEVQIIMEQVSL
jgi:hypothetical protein